MGKILVIAEKPSVARDIGKVLKSTTKGNGCLIGEKYIITWAIGHLVTLCDPDDYDEKLKKWKRETLPIMPKDIKLKAIPRTREQLSIIYKLIKSEEIDKIICATDSGREGELIFRYIYEISKTKKPFKRLWISSMTTKAIKDGFDNLKDGKEYDNLYYSAKCRSEADWLVGINSTRAYTLKYNALLSIGRVQTPTLNLIVERTKEIKDFKSKVYYEVMSKYKEFSGKLVDEKLKTKKIDKEDEAEQIVLNCNGKNGKVESIKKEEKKQVPPLLYDLTELQIDSNKKYGYTAKKTLEVAQNLYEKRKLITYPRTDSKFLSTDMKSGLMKVIKSVKVDPYIEYVEYLEGLDRLKITKRIINDSKITDHHAIIPTGKKPNMQILGVEERRIYDLIVRRFISVFYDNYKYDVTTVIININNNLFESKGIVVQELGFNEVYKIFKSKKKTTKEEELPKLEKGKDIKVKKISKEKKETKPPKHFTEATLLSSMENAGRLVEDEKLKEMLKESGLGTPATRASIIERLISVKYLQRKGKNLIATEKGIKVIEVVPKELKSPETTGRWEKGLNSISKGEMEVDKFMGSIRRFVKYIVEESDKNIGIQFEEENKFIRSNGLGKCPKCSGTILENRKAYFCSRWKNNCKISIWKNGLEKEGIEINNKFIKELLKEGKVEIGKNENIDVIELESNLTGRLIISKK